MFRNIGPDSDKDDGIFVVDETFNNKQNQIN